MSEKPDAAQVAVRVGRIATRQEPKPPEPVKRT